MVGRSTTFDVIALFDNGEKGEWSNSMAQNRPTNYISKKLMNFEAIEHKLHPPPMDNAFAAFDDVDVGTLRLAFA